MKKKVHKRDLNMLDKQRPGEWKWEKKWDRMFRDLLGGVAVEGGGQWIATFNDLAKQFIKSEIIKAEQRVISKHNLVAMAFDGSSKSESLRKRTIRDLSLLMQQFTEHKKYAEKYEKSTKKLLDSIKK